MLWCYEKKGGVRTVATRCVEAAGVIFEATVLRRRSHGCRDRARAALLDLYAPPLRRLEDEQVTFHRCCSS